MDRKEFIKSCAFACLNGVAISTILQSCANSKMLHIDLSNDAIVVPLSEFNIEKKGHVTFHKFILLQNEKLAFPIALFRISEKQFSAVNLKCSHQGAELQVFGDKLVCPAHGSEFSNLGLVENGPATENLRNFPLKLENNNIIISLK